jgi:glycosyltransferase involved in cell wall biosynthesis
MAALVPKRWRRPMIATAHGVDLHAQRRFPIDQLRRFTLKRTAQVVAVSSDLEQIVVELSPKTPVITAPMGTDFSEVIRQTEPRVPTAGQIAFLGRLADKKGVDVLLRAVAGIPDATLLIAGDGPERPRLDALAVELGIGDRVTFLGRTARAQVYELLRTCAVLCIPSVVGVDGDQEGTPVVFAEACAAGVPVVASTIGGLGELLDESTGYPVEAGNVDALRRGLEAALTDPSAAQAKAETAREHLAETLDLRAIASLYDRMYRDLAAG